MAQRELKSQLLSELFPNDRVAEGPRRDLPTLPNHVRPARGSIPYSPVQLLDGDDAEFSIPGFLHDKVKACTPLVSSGTIRNRPTKRLHNFVLV